MISSRHWALLLVCIVGAASSPGCQVLSPPEKHLIPSGFHGEVFVVPNIPGGVPLGREGIAIVFTVPEDGILVTQDSFSPGWHKTSYFFVDSAGNRTRVPVADPNRRQNKESTLITELGTGTTFGYDLPCPVYFSHYYVGTASQWQDRAADTRELEFYDFVRENEICP